MSLQQRVAVTRLIVAVILRLFFYAIQVTALHHAGRPASLSDVRQFRSNLLEFVRQDSTGVAARQPANIGNRIETSRKFTTEVRPDDENGSLWDEVSCRWAAPFPPPPCRVSYGKKGLPGYVDRLRRV